MIDPNIKGPEHLSESMIVKRKNGARGYSIHHLDETYQRKIFSESDPGGILKKLRMCKKVEINVAHTAVRTNLY